MDNHHLRTTESGCGWPEGHRPNTSTSAGMAASAQIASARRMDPAVRRRASRHNAQGTPPAMIGAASGYQGGLVTIHAKAMTSRVAESASTAAVQMRRTPARNASQAPAAVAATTITNSLHKYERAI